MDSTGWQRTISDLNYGRYAFADYVLELVQVSTDSLKHCYFTVQLAFKGRKW